MTSEATSLENGPEPASDVPSPAASEGGAPSRSRWSVLLVRAVPVAVAFVGPLAFLLLELQRNLAYRYLFENSDAAYINLYSEALISSDISNRWKTPPASSLFPDVLFGGALHLIGIDGRWFSSAFVVLAALLLLGSVATVVGALGVPRPWLTSACITGTALILGRFAGFGLMYLFVPGHHGLQASAVVLTLGLGLLASRRGSAGLAAVVVVLALAVTWSDPWYAPSLSALLLVLGAATLVRWSGVGQRLDRGRLAAGLVVAALPMALALGLRATASAELASYQRISWTRVGDNLTALASLSPTDNLDLVGLVLGLAVVSVIAVRQIRRAGSFRRALGDDRTSACVVCLLAAWATAAQGLLQPLNARYFVLIPTLALLMAASMVDRTGSRTFTSVVVAVGAACLAVGVTHLSASVPPVPGVACVEQALRADGTSKAFGTYWQAKYLRSLIDGVDITPVDAAGGASDWIDLDDHRIRARVLVADDDAQLDAVAAGFGTGVESTVECGTAVVGVLDQPVTR